MSKSDHKISAGYLLIGGTTKAATTSIFTYLRDHPEVCAANLKESRFFLDTSYPVSMYNLHYTGGVEQYNRLFVDCGDERWLHVEATPDYLYSAGTPERVRQLLPNAKWVFVLRDPLDRLVSWYRFAKQYALIDAKLGFEAFIDMQQMEPDAEPETPQHLLVLEQGRYAHYLERFLTCFGSQNVLVLFFEEFRASPQGAMHRISEFAGLDAGFYDAYDFRAMNVTRSTTYPKLNRFYKDISRRLRDRVQHQPWLHDLMRGLRARIEPVFFRLTGSSRQEKVVIQDRLRERLQAYYAGESERIGALIGRQAPWGRNI